MLGRVSPMVLQAEKIIVIQINTKVDFCILKIPLKRLKCVFGLFYQFNDLKNFIKID